MKLTKSLIISSSSWLSGCSAQLSPSFSESENPWHWFCSIFIGTYPKNYTDRLGGIYILSIYI